MPKLKKLPLGICLAVLSMSTKAETSLDAVSVTATKQERKALNVSQSVDVVESKTIQKKNARNINDVIKTMPGVIAVSKNGGYDSRLIIRGAGLKAAYGVREIMVLRDGVPMTDPDSFTRFDFVDIDDISSVEVFRGPGSIAASNASGGVLSINSQSVFDGTKDYIKLGAGSETSRNAALHKTWEAGQNDNFSIQFSRRQADNNWRQWNQFDTTQFSIKQGHFFKGESTLESELSYQESNLQLPGSLSASGYANYLKTGKTINDKTNTGSAFSKSSRDSKTLFFNTRYKTKLSKTLEFKPQFYVNQWQHLHPVTGIINDSKDNYVIGTDLMFDRKHQLFGHDASQVFGLTLRGDIRNKGKKYQYRDTVVKYGRIVDVTSDAKGTLASVEDSSNLLSGAYFQQTLSPADRWQMDLGLRYDHLAMDIAGDEYWKYDYAQAKYLAGQGHYTTRANYDLFAPKVSLNYELAKASRLYTTVSGAQQAPTESEISNNRSYGQATDLKASTALQYEVGYKRNTQKLQTTFALYQIDLTDEIVGVKNGTTTYYVNAGKTQKKGAELNLSYQLLSTVDIGGAAAWQDYRYLDYKDSGADYSGKHVRFIPEQQYSLFANYQNKGYQARIEGLAFGDYYIDDANTEKYKGYNMVTNAMVAYRHKAHLFQLNVNNVFDMRYAEEVSKDSRGSYSYSPGAPRNIQLNYRYKL